MVTKFSEALIIYASGILSTDDAYLSGTWNITSLATNDDLIYSSSNHYEGNLIMTNTITGKMMG